MRWNAQNATARELTKAISHAARDAALSATERAEFAAAATGRVEVATANHTEATMRFWISWVQKTEDPRPINYPPNEAILGWWQSGYDQNDWPTLCACVDAESASAASCALIEEWPELEAEIMADGFHWRFYEHNKGDDWRPGNRFPLADWMVPRFAVAAAMRGAK